MIYSRVSLNYDFRFQIFAGPLSDTYDGIFCGNNTIYYATSSDLVTIEFRSDGAITGSGFRIEFGRT